MSAAEALSRAQWLAAGGDVEAAAAIVERVLRVEPDHLGLLLLRAHLHLQAREPERALRLHERATEIAGHSSETWNALARCRHALGQDREALLAAEEAHRLLAEGDNQRHAAAVYLTLVWCLRALRRYREALDFAEQGLARVPDSILAQWAATVEEELAEANKEGC
jgi:tetratricopeptide (TPR) repeat protein